VLRARRRGITEQGKTGAPSSASIVANTKPLELVGVPGKEGWMEERRAGQAAPWKRLGALLAAAFVAFAPRAASAFSDVGIEIPYSVDKGISGCLSEAAFQDDVRQRLTEERAPLEQPIVVATRIERQGNQLLATVTLRTPTHPVEVSQTIFAAPNECATLSKAAALAVSLTIERARRQAQPAPPAPPTPPPSTAPPVGPPPAAPKPVTPPGRPAPVQPRRPAAPRSRPARISLRTHALLTSSVGVLPDVSLGTTAGASLRRGPWSAGLEAGASYPSTVESSTRRDGGKAWLVFLSGSACAHRHGLFVCGVGLVGDFRAVGTGQLVSRSSDSLYVALGARLGADVPLGGPFSVAAHGGLFAPLLRPSLRIGDELLWRSPALGGEFGLGIRMSIL
jgi:hypothetical protein